MGALGPPDEQVPPLRVNGNWHGGPRLTTDEPFSRSQFANMPPPKAALGIPKSVGAHPSSQPGGPTADPIQHPAEFIRLVFDLVVATDKEGYFLRPVDESVAPNYYKQIKQPLCFADMRDKLESGMYTSYKAIMTDFDLIVSNAKTFNKEKTKCYKCASTLSRNIAKIMSTHEIGMRKAFSVLHPGTIPGSAGFGSTSNKGTPNLMDTSDMTSAGTSSAQATGGQSRGGLLGDLPTDPRDRPGEAPVRQPSIKAEPPVTAGPSGHVALRIKRPVPPPPQPPPASIPLPPIRLEPLCKAYSDNEEEDQRLVLHHHRQTPEGQPSAQCRKLVPLEALMAGLRQAATFQPWPGLQDNQGGGMQAQGGAGAAGACGTAVPPANLEHGNQQEGTISPLTAQPDMGQDIEVQAGDSVLAQGSIEWQCHWLQLRMRELQAQMGRLAGSPDAGAVQAGQQQPGQAAMVVTSNGGGCSGSSAAVAAELAERKRQLTAAAARHSQGGPTALLLPGHVAQSRLHVPVAHRPLASTTFFAGRPASAGAAASTQHASGTPATGALLQPLVAADGDVEMTDAVGVAIAGPSAPATGSDSMTAAGPSAEGPNAAVRAAPAQLTPSPAEHVSTAAAAGLTPATSAMAATAGHSGLLASQPSAVASVLAAIPDAQLPAAVFASLETLEMQLLDVKRGLQAAFALDRGRARAGVSRTGTALQLGSAASGAVAGSAPGAAGLLRRPSSVVRPLPPPRTSSLANMGSFKSGSEPASKRKRADGEAEMQPYFSRSLDRPSASIYIPEVRELCQEEVQARIEAVAQGAGTWHEAYKTQGAIALDHPPPIIASALAACSDEGSSSEDTSDEAYANMHAIMAEEERKRFAAAAVEGQRRRNKQQSKTAPAAQQPASAGQGGPSTVPASGPSGPTRRHSYGIKAPRPASAAQLPLSPQITQPAPAPPSEGLGLDGPKHHHHHQHHHPPPVPPVPTDRSLPVQRAAQPHPPAAPIHTRRSPPAVPAAPTTHPHQQAIMRVLSINTGHTASHSVPAVVLVPTSTPTSVPAVATAPHPFILQTAGSLLPGLTPAPGLRRSSSGVPSSAPSHPPRPPSNPGSNPPSQPGTATAQPSVLAITPPGHITTRGSSPRVAVAAAATTAAPALPPPVVAPPPPHQPPAAAAPQPRRTPRRPATTPAPLPTPSPPPSSSNDDDARQGHSGSRGPSTEVEDKDESGSGSQESSESESDTSQEGEEGEEDSESGSDESQSGDSSGSSDGTRDSSDGDGDDEGEDDQAGQSSGGGAAPRKRRADRQTSQPRRSSGGGARQPAVANGSSARNGRRPRGAADLGKKVVVRMTRSQDQGKLRSRSTPGGGVTKPARTPSHGGAAPPRRR